MDISGPGPLDNKWRNHPKFRPLVLLKPMVVGILHFKKPPNGSYPQQPFIFTAKLLFLGCSWGYPASGLYSIDSRYITDILTDL